MDSESVGLSTIFLGMCTLLYAFDDNSLQLKTAPKILDEESKGDGQFWRLQRSDDPERRDRKTATFGSDYAGDRGANGR